ncbi:MAG: YajQ family cyclic di-GMP-binding protein [Gammaproteobacteria bacterium]|nr:YajQ family cyclic di-GMP-binding protein [Gammaproteobacteria bacterium]
MPSFDVVSEIDWQEVRNAVDQSKRELGTRFDFRHVDAGIELAEKSIQIHAEEEFQLQQLLEILKTKFVSRKVDIKVLQPGEVTPSGKTKRQVVNLVEGIDRATTRLISKRVKDLNKKLQVQVQGYHVRISGKKRDELQQIIAALRDLDLPMPLQFKNYRN